MSSKSEKEKKKGKKEKKKKLIIQEIKDNTEVQEITKKNNIFSMLDRLDDISKAKGQMKEEKLRKDLIESEQSEKGKRIETKKLGISEIRKELAKLNELKNRYHLKGDYQKASEISEEIIVLAFSNKLKSVVNEENKFLELMQNKKNQETTNTEILEQDESLDTTKLEQKVKTTTQENISIKLDLPEIHEKQDLKEERLNLDNEKEKFEQEKLKFEEDKEAFKWERQMFKELKKHERDKEVGVKKENESAEIIEVDSEEKEKFDKEKRDFEVEKEKFIQLRLEFEEEKEAFKRERFKLEKEKDIFEEKKQQFKEEKESFKWEKQMFEEARRFETDKNSS